MNCTGRTFWTRQYADHSSHSSRLISAEMKAFGFTVGCDATST